MLYLSSITYLLTHILASSLRSSIEYLRFLLTD